MYLANHNAWSTDMNNVSLCVSGGVGYRVSERWTYIPIWETNSKETEKWEILSNLLLYSMLSLIPAWLCLCLRAHVSMCLHISVHALKLLMYFFLIKSESNSNSFGNQFQNRPFNTPKDIPFYGWVTVSDNLMYPLTACCHTYKCVLFCAKKPEQILFVPKIKFNYVDVPLF